jgi:outer membrane protein OmpA-like peptidoglycan-associated protein
MFRKILFALIFIPLLAINAQNKKSNSDNLLFGRLFIGVESGAAWGIMDAKKLDYNLSVRGVFEYHFASWGKHTLGFKQYFGGGNLRHTFISPQIPEAQSEYKSDQLFIGGGLTYSYSISKVFSPYVFAGVTSFLINNKSGSYVVNPVNISSEFGLKIVLVDGFSINLTSTMNYGKNDVLNRLIPGEQGKASYAGYLGISYGFNLFGESVGQEEIIEPEEIARGLSEAEPEILVDSDKDGIPDISDKCPNTPRFLAVDSTGCPYDSDFDGVPDYIDLCPNTPPNVLVDQTGCTRDTDNDGVPDHLDDCPDTPADVKVDSYGCPIDSDADGVADYLDECPNSLPGAVVDSLGCERIVTADFKEVIKIVYFETDQIEFANSSYLKDLEDLKVIMLENPNSVWRIAGHSDSFEATSLDKNIAMARAQFIKDYFVNNGIDAKRFELFDMGAEYPVESNLTIAGRAKNRRAIIIRIK